MKYFRKTKKVDAVQWDKNNFQAIINIDPNSIERISETVLRVNQTGHLAIGDYLVQNEDGLLVCPLTNFHKLYSTEDPFPQLPPPQPVQYFVPPDEGMTYDAFYMNYLKCLIVFCAGNLTKAAKVSGISRTSLYYQLKQRDLYKFLYEVKGSL